MRITRFNETPPKRPKRTIRVSVEQSNNADEWWTAAQEAAATNRRIPRRLRRWLLSSTFGDLLLTVTEADKFRAWCESLPGWSTGPLQPLSFTTAE